MPFRSRVVAVCVTTVALLAAGGASALTVDELRALRESDERVLVVDIRSAALFEAGHIQGAIHVPRELIERKKLPALGRVVVCGDGLDAAGEEQAVAALNAKPGIRAERLEGGYPAWSGAGQASSVAPGLHPGGVRQLTYAELVEAAAANRDLVLVDLRLASGARQLVDLGTTFPGVRVLLPGSAARRRVAEGEAEPEALVRGLRISADRLYVLVDDGDGRAAEAAARQFVGRGVGRVAILAGGEQTLRTKGVVREETRETGAGAP